MMTTSTYKKRSKYMSISLMCAYPYKMEGSKKITFSWNGELN